MKYKLYTPAKLPLEGVKKRRGVMVCERVEEITADGAVAETTLVDTHKEKVNKPGMRIRGWLKKRIRGSIPQTNGDFKKSIE